MTTKKIYSVFIFLIVSLQIFFISAVYAETTEVSVRVLSKGAKFIGTSLNGAEVTIKDHFTGEVLAQGVTEGGTGSTKIIMQQAHTRNAPLSDENSAVFTAKLVLEEPRKLEFIAKGPMNNLNIANTASVTQWVVPGKHLNGGDGVVLEIPGFALTWLHHPDGKKYNSVHTTVVPLKIEVTMMCGCPITPGGLWDANNYEFAVIIKHDGKKINTQTLEYAGKASEFQTNIMVEKPGHYEITVYAYDPNNGNTGVLSSSFSVIKNTTQ